MIDQDSDASGCALCHLSYRAISKIVEKDGGARKETGVTDGRKGESGSIKRVFAGGGDHGIILPEDKAPFRAAF